MKNLKTQASKAKNQVQKLRNNRRKDYIGLGQWLNNIREKKLYKHMTPSFSSLKAYLGSEGFTLSYAYRAINTWEKFEGLLKVVGAERANSIQKQLFQMSKANLNTLCRLPVKDIAELVESNQLNQLNERQLRSKVRNLCGDSPLKKQINLSVYDQELILIIKGLDKLKAPRNQGIVKKELQLRLQRRLLAL